MFLVADELHGVLHVAVGILEHAKFELRLDDARRRRRQDVFVNLARVCQFFHLVNQADGFAADAVHTALGDANQDGFFVGHFFTHHRAAAFLNRPNHAPVGLDDALKAHFVAQQVLQRRLRADGGVLHVQLQRDRVVRHDGSNVDFQRRIIRLQVNLQRFRAGNDGRGVLALHLRPCAGEMLHAGHDSAGVQPVAPILERNDLRRDHLRHKVRVFAERLHDAPPAGFRGNVGFGRQRHANADGDMLIAGNFRQTGDKVFVTGCRQRQIMPGNGRAGDVRQAMHGVHRHQHRHAQARPLSILLNRVHGHRSCFHAVQFANQQHADAFLIAPLVQVGWNLAIGARQVRRVLHLCNFLAHRHLPDQVRRAGVSIQSPVLVGVKRAVAVQVDKLVAVNFDDALHMGIERRLGVGFFLRHCGSSPQSGCKRQRAQHRQRAPHPFLSQQGSILLSRQLP